MSYSNMRNAFLEFCSNRPKLPVLKTIGVARIFDWGGPKPSKIRLSSPKLRVNFGPKSDIRTIFPPKIR